MLYIGILLIGLFLGWLTKITIKKLSTNYGSELTIPFIELPISLVILFIYLKRGLTLESLILTIIFIGIISAIILDQKFKVLPNKITFSLFILGVLLLPINPILTTYIDGLLGGTLMFLFFLFCSFFGMGLGDLKFMTGLGLLLGLNIIMLGTFIGFLLAALESITLKIYKKLKEGENFTDTIPLGPALGLGVISSYFILNFL